MLRGEAGVVLGHFVFHGHQACRVSRDLGGLRNHRTDELSAEANIGALQNRVFGVIGLGQSRGVEVREHSDHAFDSLRCTRVDPADPAQRDRRLHRVEVGGVLHRLVEGVVRGAAHLGHAVKTPQVRADGLGFDQFRHCPSLR